MIKSKGWKWEMVSPSFSSVWKNPCIESFYLVNRWKSQNKNDFLDLGCGLGRHTVLFAKNNFNVTSFDISEEAINKTKAWCQEEGLTCNYKIGDMLSLPFNDNSFDAIVCINVISHTDTEGLKKVISEIKRVLKNDGECYLTLCSKDTWAYKDTQWPEVDPNTKLRMEEGPEYKVAHVFVDYDLVQELFKDFEIIDLRHVGNFYEHPDKTVQSYHYHILIKKVNHGTN